MRLFITKKATKELDKIPGAIARKISVDILALVGEPFPSNSKKLQGQDNYRMRVGSFRVIYTVNKKNKEITILRVADRRTVYR